jgi:hypothetical protein
MDDKELLVSENLYWHVACELIRQHYMYCIVFPILDYLKDEKIAFDCNVDMLTCDICSQLDYPTNRNSFDLVYGILDVIKRI